MKNENLEKLLSQFMNQGDAQQSLHDIEIGDSLFDQNPVPALNEQTIERITSQVRCSLQKQKRQLFVFKSSAAAAVVAIVVLAGLYMLGSSHTQTSSRYLASNSQNFWTKMALHDEIMASMENELTDVAQSMDDIESNDEYKAVRTLSIDMLELEELELMAANTDFWKG